MVLLCCIHTRTVHRPRHRLFSDNRAKSLEEMNGPNYIARAYEVRCGGPAVSATKGRIGSGRGLCAADARYRVHRSPRGTSDQRRTITGRTGVAARIEFAVLPATHPAARHGPSKPLITTTPLAVRKVIQQRTSVVQVRAVR